MELLWTFVSECYMKVSGLILMEMDLTVCPLGHFYYYFSNKCSCPTSLLDLFASVIDTYFAGNNKAVDHFHLDFLTAFVKVPHDRILVKVKAHMASTVVQPNGSGTG